MKLPEATQTNGRIVLHRALLDGLRRSSSVAG
jgi:hypothetical protein